MPVRFHTENVVSDVFGAQRELDAVIENFSRRGRGVIVYLREGSVGVARHMLLHTSGEDHAEAREREDEWRQIGLGAQILKDLGVTSIRLVASRERHYIGLEGFGLEIEATEIMERG